MFSIKKKVFFIRRFCFLLCLWMGRNFSFCSFWICLQKCWKHKLNLCCSEREMKPYVYTMWNRGFHVWVCAGVYVSSLSDPSCQRRVAKNLIAIKLKPCDKQFTKLFDDDPTKDVVSCHPNQSLSPILCQTSQSALSFIVWPLRNRITAITEKETKLKKKETWATRLEKKINRVWMCTMMDIDIFLSQLLSACVYVSRRIPAVVLERQKK